MVKKTFAHIFQRENINAAFIDGECFRRYDRDDMQAMLDQAEADGRVVTPFGPEVNRFDLMEELFQSYGENGSGRFRRYVSEEFAQEAGDELDAPSGSFTDWQEIPAASDLLFYEGLHGGVVANRWSRRQMSASHNPKVIVERRNADKKSGVDVAQHVDLLLGIVPVVNLEWMQKITRDMHTRGYSQNTTTARIIERMQEYIHFIVPQFSVTDINFQRVPVVDTSNPFIATEVPEPHECKVVIRFRDPQRYDFPRLQELIDGAFMSRPNTMVISGSQMQQALDVICTPLILQLLEA